MYQYLRGHFGHSRCTGSNPEFYDIKYLLQQKIDALVDLPDSQSLCQRDIPTSNKQFISSQN